MTEPAHNDAAHADTDVAESPAEGGGPVAAESDELRPIVTQPSNPKEDFALQLHARIEGRRSVSDGTYEEALVEYAIEAVGDEQFDDPIAFSYVEIDSFSGETRMRIDGYDLHEEDDDDRDVIDLFVVHPGAPLTSTDGGEATVSLPVIEGLTVNALFRAVRRFVEESRHELHLELAHDPEARDVAKSIKASQHLARVNINLVTNAEVRQFDRNPEMVDGIEIIKRVLDLNYLRRLSFPDPIEVDFSAAQPGGIPCVPLPDKNGTYRSFLAIVPGAFLCKLYEKYHQRLLEANVRSYLRANNKSVNHGILVTIRDHPEMFFAYNNGITATADEIVVEGTAEGGKALVRCCNLQIVNGGQTTASLFHANLKKIPLDQVFVPMKINEVIDHSRTVEIVQKISFSANSQNKVNFSDFGANQEFHVRLQKLGQSEAPPAPAIGKSLGAKWYYERMRGQYQTDSILAGKGKSRKEFLLEYPKDQILTKTSVAKYYMIWTQRPHDVSRGSEKNYQRFLGVVSPAFSPEAEWFHALVATVLITEHCDALVVRSKIPGYKANIVAYAVALLSHVRGRQVDLHAIWRAQRVDSAIDGWLKHAIEPVRAHLTAPPREGMNVGEWCKKEDCWRTLIAAWSEEAKKWP